MDSSQKDPAALFVDTNVFLRFLTADHPTMSEDCRRLFERAEAGDFHLHASHLVVAEIAWTLRSYYGLARADIAAALGDLIALRSLRIDHKEMLRDAIAVYASTGADFIDAYHERDCRRRGLDVICSYDRDFDAIGGERAEPAALLG